jgi:lysophospholipase L1-like esterase
MPTPIPFLASTPRAPRRGAVVGATLLAALLAAGCAKDPELVTSVPPNGADFMARYVALGNSITAGFQSGGINDSTQRRSYANLLARATGTRFAYPSLAGRGCAPPLTDFLAQTRYTLPGLPASTATTCDLRAGASSTATLNNVAVPDANSFDPTGLTGGRPNALTQFFLGGRTQVERAVDVAPTFATIWIGNTDVLGFAAAGTTEGVTPEATFRSNYDAMIDQLRRGSPELQRGVLIGVVDVTNIPLLVPAALFVPGSPAFSPAVQAAVQQLVGRPLQLVNCPTSTGALVAFPFFAQLRAATAQLPAGVAAPFACAPTPGPGGVQLGAAGILDEAERVFFTQRVAAYNAYLATKAQSIGFQYLDPNPIVLSWRTSGQVPFFPQLSATPGARVFGPFFSLDGVHPSTRAHLVLADTLRLRINRAYGSSIPAPDTTLLGR